MAIGQLEDLSLIWGIAAKAVTAAVDEIEKANRTTYSDSSYSMIEAQALSRPVTYIAQHGE